MAAACSASSVGDHNDLALLSKRIFAIQEERKLLYTKMKRAHEDYIKASTAVNERTSLREYQQDMSSTTQSFSLLSQEMITIKKTFISCDRKSVSDILEEIQKHEKDKLSLTVQYHINVINEGEVENDEEEGILSVSVIQEIKRKLSYCESNISSLLEDLRYECEDLLLKDVSL